MLSLLSRIKGLQAKTQELHAMPFRKDNNIIKSSISAAYLMLLFFADLQLSSNRRTADENHSPTKKEFKFTFKSLILQMQNYFLPRPFNSATFRWGRLASAARQNKLANRELCGWQLPKTHEIYKFYEPRRQSRSPPPQPNWLHAQIWHKNKCKAFSESVTEEIVGGFVARKALRPLLRELAAWSFRKRELVAASE